MGELSNLDTEDWDDLTLGILEELQRVGGSATTTELRRHLDCDRHQLNYRRRRYLEPNGLVVSSDMEDEPGNLAPKKIEITGEGRAVIEYMVLDRPTEHKSWEQRVREIEDELGELNKELTNEVVKHRQPLEDNVDELEGKLDEVLTRLDELEERVTTLEKRDEPRNRRRQRRRKRELE